MTNNGEDSDQDVEDFSDPDVDEVSDNNDDEGPEEVEDVYGPSFNNPRRGIILRNKPGGDMLTEIQMQRMHSSSLSCQIYTDIICWGILESRRWVWLASLSCIYIDDSTVANTKIRKVSYMYCCTYDSRPLEIGCQKYLQLHHATSERWPNHSCVDIDCRHVSSISVQSVVQESVAMQQLYNDWDESYNELQGYELEAHRFRHKLGRVEIDMGNEFPVLRDVSTWEVQPHAFEMLPDWSLRRRVKG
ncbi:hypothetical protein GOBAR_AA15591 [Gossypium barbadense]|uniref:Uncharacterized protein n=1 Tax=Gossypium barbadense TaxID=3634 RepID=A0A2P5XNX7_GOSBA|nr:hypothetical protein GOBAR_AA15591 [Gossypium barbadense]